MKQKVLESLKNKYSNLGFGEKAFDGVADFLSNNIEKEEDIAERVNGVEGLLKAFQGDLDKARGEKTQLQKELNELKKQAPSEEKEPKPTEESHMEKKLRELEETIQKLQGNEIHKSRQQILEETLKGTSEGFGKVTRSSFEYLKNASEEDYNNWIEGIETTAKENIESQAAYNPRSGVKIDGKISDEEANNIVGNLIG